jgi:OTU domain-containing protein 6
VYHKRLSTMDELQARHRKEQRDLIAKITQKKKSATKKTRKGVNDECADLERELKERQEKELANLNGEPAEEDNAKEATAGEVEPPQDDLEHAARSLSLEPNIGANGTSASAPSIDSAPKKRNRAKERLARRAAEQEALVSQAEAEAASIPDLREQEKQSMAEQFRQKGLQEKFIRPDGHCLYSAVADQLQVHGIDLKPDISLSTVQITDEEFKKLSPHNKVRSAAAAYISEHADDFVPFLEKGIDEYIHEVKDTAEWGGHVELLALAKTYDVPIRVLQGSGPVQKIGDDSDADEAKAIWLAYYRHNFGLGEHYNSLRKV